MSTLYTKISQIGKAEIIVLNRNYTKEQLREKLTVPDGLDKDYAEYILSKGIYLPEGEVLKVKFSDEGTITTQCRGSIWYMYKRDKVVVKPDGGFQTTHYLTPVQKIYYWVESCIDDLVIEPYRNWKRKWEKRNSID